MDRPLAFDSLALLGRRRDCRSPAIIFPGQVKNLAPLGAPCPLFATLVLVTLILNACKPSIVARPLSPPAATQSGTTKGIRFESVAAADGVQFQWPRQPRPMRNLEAFGCGCAFLDYDNDGWQDILLVAQPNCHLYHNKGHGQFEDVTEATGLGAIKGAWTGCAAGDYDGDGYLDIVLTGYRCLALLHNRDGKTFINTTKAAGLDAHNQGQWGSSAGFMDLAGNGRLDLVVLNYVIFGPGEKQYCDLRPGVRSGCPPDQYRPEFGQLWENIGGGRYKDVTATSGMKDTHGKALVVAFADIQNTGRMDFYIGNDGTPADLMHNLGHMRFQNRGVESGVAYGGSLQQALAAMGADWGDYNRDGRPDLFVTAFSDQSFALFRNAGAGVFKDVSDETNLSGPTYKPLGFGAKWIDVDNDGWPDLLIVNGHVYDNVEQIDASSSFRQPLMLFHNLHGQEFKDLAPLIGGDMVKPILGRGLATGDIDNDGQMDFLAVDFEGEPLLMHNVSSTANHWITLDLRSRSYNHFAYGAQVTAQAGTQIWTGEVSPASAYLSSSDPRVHFGLGPVSALDRITIRWPDERQESVVHVPVDRIVRFTEGAGITIAATRR